MRAAGQNCSCWACAGMGVRGCRWVQVRVAVGDGAGQPRGCTRKNRRAGAHAGTAVWVLVAPLVAARTRKGNSLAHIGVGELLTHNNGITLVCVYELAFLEGKAIKHALLGIDAFIKRAHVR